MNKALTIEDFLDGKVKTISNKVKKPKAKVIIRDNTVNFSQDVKDKVWTRDGGACVRCRSELQLQFDHKYPVVKWPKDKNGNYKPGLNGYANCQLLCKKCNSKKHAKIKDDTWYDGDVLISNLKSNIVMLEKKNEQIQKYSNGDAEHELLKDLKSIKNKSKYLNDELNWKMLDKLEDDILDTYFDMGIPWDRENYTSPFEDEEHNEKYQKMVKQRCRYFSTKYDWDFEMLQYSDDFNLICIWDHGHDYEYFAGRVFELIEDLIDDGMFEPLTPPIQLSLEI